MNSDYYGVNGDHSSQFLCSDLERPMKDAERMSVDPAMRNAHCNISLQHDRDGTADLTLTCFI